MVVKNEADRYLADCLWHHSRIWDELFVYDDRSTDTTVEDASWFGDVTVRDESDVSFMEHEGDFRTEALSRCIFHYGLTKQDWIFALDADEFLVSTQSGAHDTYLRTLINNCIYDAEVSGKRSVMIPIPELWRADPASLRGDGFWNQMSLPRLYQAPGHFEDWAFMPKSMGCGSGPRYTYKDPLKQDALALLHMGYAVERDRETKFERYTSLENHGHNVRHINSIVEEPDLIPYKGAIPPILSDRVRRSPS